MGQILYLARKIYTAPRTEVPEVQSSLQIPGTLLVDQPDAVMGSVLILVNFLLVAKHGHS